MTFRFSLIFAILTIAKATLAQETLLMQEINLAGVYQGKTLFIQNYFLKERMAFCIEEVRINGRRVDMNYDISALKLDFEGIDLYAPVKIRIIHSDTTCISTIINPEAVLFHTIFRFSSIELSDSVLIWTTKGERRKGEFEVEKLASSGQWEDQEVIAAFGEYEGATYHHFPNLKEGANKYRIRYNFPSGSRMNHLYSEELEIEYYPERVQFNPKYAKRRLYLSRTSKYEIYDQGNTLVLEGRGKEVDITPLRRGRYVIYFNGKFPGGFNKE